MKRSSLLVLVLALAALVGGAWLAERPPHLLVVNAGMRVAYPWTASFGALLVAAAFVAAAWLTPRRSVRAIAVLVALPTLLAAYHLLRYRIEVDDKALSARDWTGTVSLPWQEVKQVDAGALGVMVYGTGETSIQIDTERFRPQDRAALDRNIKRHVETAGPLGTLH